jgi:hypothetical protein
MHPSVAALIRLPKDVCADRMLALVALGRQGPGHGLHHAAAPTSADRQIWRGRTAHWGSTRQADRWR